MTPRLKPSKTVEGKQQAAEIVIGVIRAKRVHGATGQTSSSQMQGSQLSTTLAMNILLPRLWNQRASPRRYHAVFQHSRTIVKCLPTSFVERKAYLVRILGQGGVMTSKVATPLRKANQVPGQFTVSVVNPHNAGKWSGVNYCDRTQNYCTNDGWQVVNGQTLARRDDAKSDQSGPPAMLLYRTVGNVIVGVWNELPIGMAFERPTDDGETGPDSGSWGMFWTNDSIAVYLGKNEPGGIFM